VAENAATFTIRVKNPALIDFEKTQQLRFKVSFFISFGFQLE
jgi:hypothetical protein